MAGAKDVVGSDYVTSTAVTSFSLPAFMTPEPSATAIVVFVVSFSAGVTDLFVSS